MKIPRDVGGAELAKVVECYGYKITRQAGSHLRLTTTMGGEHHITIPAHRSLKMGTLSAILNEIAQHLKKDKSQLVREIWP